MTLDHTTIEELLAVQALGGLDGDDIEILARERASHGDCEECRRLEDDFTETAGRFPLALDPEPVDPAMVDRIVSTPAGDDVSRRREGRADQRWRAVAAVAAALAVIVIAASALRPSPTAPSIASPSQQIVTFEGDADAGNLSMAYTPGRPGAVFWGTDMPALAEGQVYEIWMFQGDTPIGSGCVSPQDGTIAVSVDADVGSSELMAVTVEDAACPDAPTTPPILSAELV